jgi:glutamate synthase (ferredoxin)
MLKIESPVLNEAELAEMQQVEGFSSITLSTLYPLEQGSQGLAEQVQQLCQQASQAVAAGHKIIILSDRGLTGEQTYIPPLLAVGAVHHHLIKESTRLKVSLVVETAQCWSTHHFACLMGYGASAVCPYLALESVAIGGHSPRFKKPWNGAKWRQ